MRKCVNYVIINGLYHYFTSLLNNRPSYTTYNKENYRVNINLIKVVIITCMSFKKLKNIIKFATQLI